jgi:large subunit ribosomal protein L30
MAETMLRVTQVGSIIGRPQDQRATVRSLGLRRIRHTVLQPDRPEIRGMLTKVGHLVTFEVLSADEAKAFAADAEAKVKAVASRPAGPAPGSRAKDVAKQAWKAKLAERSAADAKRAARDASTTAVAAPAAAADADEVSDAAAASAKKAAKKTAAKKTTTGAAKKTAAKKTAAKKTAEKKPAAKKSAAKKATKKSEG